VQLREQCLLLGLLDAEDEGIIKNTIIIPTDAHYYKIIEY